MQTSQENIQESLQSPPRPRRPPAQFRRGDLVEVVSREEGFVGSYYGGMVMADAGKNGYVIQYSTTMIVGLREVVSAAELRPRPAMVRAAEYRVNDVVDAFDDGGWWVGRVKGKFWDMYCVQFEKTGYECLFSKDYLRLHQDWKNGKWIYV